MSKASIARYTRLGAVVLLMAALLLLSSCRCTPKQQASTEPTQTVPPTSTPPVVSPTTTPEPTSPPAVIPTAVPEPVPKPPTGPGTRVRIYLTRGEKLGVAGRSVPAGVTGIARSAVTQLLAAPSAKDRSYGLGTSIPSGTKLLGLTIGSGIATVDLSKRFESGGGSLSMRMRVAQVVYTLTQFPTVRRVAFRLDGKPVQAIGGEGVVVSPPVGRAQFEDVTPSILVEVPVPGQKVGRPLTLAGTANVFEAQFSARLKDANGKIVGPERPVKATSGSGTRGTFSVLLSYSASAHGAAKLEVFDRSEKDGSIEDLTSIPVSLP